MASYRLAVKRSVAKDLRAVPRPTLNRILERIQALAHDPRPPGCEKLSGQDRYRLRQEDYRIIYEVLDAELVVTVVRVGHRNAVYRAG